MNSTLLQRDYSHHVDELGELELDLDGNRVGNVLDGPDKLVVARQDLIIQSLGVWVTINRLWNKQLSGFCPSVLLSRPSSSHNTQKERKSEALKTLWLMADT